MDDDCENCGSPAADLRSVTTASEPTVVFLCEACNGAFEQQFVWGNAAAN